MTFLFFLDCLALNMKTLRYFKMSATSYVSTQRTIRKLNVFSLV